MAGSALSIKAGGTSQTTAPGARVALGLKVGTDVQAYSSHTLFDNTTANLTSGFTSTGYSGETISSGTFTPTPSNGNLQYYTNGGAHILAPAGVGTGNSSQVTILITNNGSAGVITTSGFTKVTGSSFTTVNASKFLCYCTTINGVSLLNVVAMQ